jgi:hypothetical protein
MPVQAKTLITAINFVARTTDTQDCRGDIRSGAVNLSYKLAGRPQVVIGTAPAGPVPPPPAPEPPTPPGNDPVTKLLDEGWKVTEFVIEQGQRTGQPAGFGIGGKYNQGVSRPGDPVIANPEFEKLDLTFTFPMFCTCAKTGKCIAANFRFMVKYDGTAHPAIGLEMSDEGPCNNVAARPINKEARLPATQLAGSTATYTFNSGVTCDCTKDGGQGNKGKGGSGDEPGKGKGKGEGGGLRAAPGKRQQGKRRDDGAGGGKDDGGKDGGEQGDGQQGDGAQGGEMRCPLTVICEYEFRTVL